MTSEPFKVGDRVIVDQHWFEGRAAKTVSPGSEVVVTYVDLYTGDDGTHQETRPGHMVVKLANGDEFWVQYDKGVRHVVTDAEVDEAIASIQGVAVTQEAERVDQELRGAPHTEWAIGQKNLAGQWIVFALELGSREEAESWIRRTDLVGPFEVIRREVTGWVDG